MLYEKVPEINNGALASITGQAPDGVLTAVGFKRGQEYRYGALSPETGYGRSVAETQGGAGSRDTVTCSNSKIFTKFRKKGEKITIRFIPHTL